MQMNRHTKCCISVHVVYGQKNIIAENAYQNETSCVSVTARFIKENIQERSTGL